MRRIGAVSVVACLAAGSTASGCGGSSTPATPDASQPDAAEVMDAALPDGSVADAAPPPPWLPLAPNATRFEWQGQQRYLVHRDTGARCNDAELAVVMTATAVCYVSAGDAQLQCAGRVADRQFGMGFAPAGMAEVDQILAAPAAVAAGAGALCVHRRDGTGWCTGDGNDQGQFNTGTTGATTDWRRWGQREQLRSLATNRFQRLCGRYANDEVECVGQGFGLTPVVVGRAQSDRFWLDSDGMVHLDELSVYRVGDGRAECRVTVAGLACGERSYGTPGEVVGGNLAGDVGDGHSACWLDGSGQVWCQSTTDSQQAPAALFVEQSVLALAVSPDSASSPGAGPARCAVVHDGSLWCVGANTEGKLGTGDGLDLVAEAEVLPPGSVRVHCN